MPSTMHSSNVLSQESAGSYTGLLNGAKYLDLRACAAAFSADIRQMPFVIRILLENVARNHLLGRPVSEDELSAVAQWNQNRDAQLSLFVERVILPDSSGLP